MVLPMVAHGNAMAVARTTTAHGAPWIVMRIALVMIRHDNSDCRKTTEI